MRRAVTVVVPSHDRASLLPPLVAQLRSQTYPQDAFEIVIVDNGSTDRTRQLAERFSSEPGPVVRYVREPRPGVTFARNRGAEEARHPYVAYADDDCSVGRGWLAQLMRGFDISPEVAAVGGLVQLEWLGTPPAWLAPELEAYYGATGHLGAALRVLDEGRHAVEFNLALEKAAFEEAGGFLGMEQFGGAHVAASEGLLLFKRLVRMGRTLAFAPNAVMRHRVASRAARGWLLRRCYWQGVSDGLLVGIEGSGRVSPRMAAAAMRRVLVHVGQAAAHRLQGDGPASMVDLTYGATWLGRMLAELHVVGDWQKVKAYALPYAEVGSHWVIS